MARRLLSAVVTVAITSSLVGLGTSPALAQPSSTGTTRAAYAAGRYIVTFADDAVASYDGTVKGYAATRPKRGQKINRNSSAVRAWQKRLVSKHDAALSKVGATKLYDYTVANNGVAAQLTAAQANKLARIAGVVGLSLDKASQPSTTFSPEYLGLSDAGGAWSQLGGARTAGAGVVVGVLDTGIWPESAAFAGNTGIPVPADWRGTCVAGELFSKKNCNDKLIGARFYVNGFGKKYIAKHDYLSPRDGSSHGTHTASTAAGNHNTTVSIDGNALGKGSGMAPGAKVAAYKVCWEGEPGIAPGCFSSDSVAAVNDAILDGVDVINYSIGGGSESDALDPVAQAFRGASNAGVYVANSAGNSGPGDSTLDHPAPWVTTVAAATFRRAYAAVELGNGARYVGASTTPTMSAAAPFITSVAGKAAGASVTNAALCAAGTLDPALVSGKVVQCDRGVVDRIEKSFEVKRAGGVGMVMTNTSENSLNGDYHPVPSVHVSHLSRLAIQTYAGVLGATARITPLTTAELAAAPQVPEIASFSSRGPSTTTDGDILKPDIAAPGVDVLAAVAPPSAHGRSWDFMSGTSMSSPHIAGLGALMKAAHPTWLPSEIKSAFMTTATDTVSSADDPFAQGAGFVNPNGALNPGLVYPADAVDFRRYMVGLGVHFAPPNDTLTPIAASNVNQASIAIGKLAGIETVTRRVRNVGAAATYTASANVAGFGVTVTPSTLTLAAGEEKSFTVAFSRTDAPLNAWAIGSLTWSSGAKSVRSTIALQPVTVSAPAEVVGDATSTGSEDFSVTPGFTGTLNATLHGLVGVTPATGSVAASPFDDVNPTPDAGTKVYEVVVPAGTRAARFSLDAVDDTSDLDLWVYLDGEFVDLSASGAADEEVTMLEPAAGTYSVYVNGFTTPGGTTAYKLANFVVGAADLPNSSVTTGVAVTVGTPVTLTASWTGLDLAQRWLGVVAYEDSEDLTIISVN